jgi:osmoprotectant transport system permease protein
MENMGDAMKKSWDWVSPFGALLGLLFLNSPNFMIFKKMRIMGTQDISAANSLGDSFYILLALNVILFTIALFSGKNKWLRRISALLAGLLIVGLFYFSDHALLNITLEKTAYSRMSIGIDMWLVIICYASVIIKANEHETSRFFRMFMICCPFVLLAVLLFSGKMDQLGIMMEYYTYKVKFLTALNQHVLISLLVIATGIAIGIPLGYLVNEKRHFENFFIPFINITETLPAISLIAIVMIPLSMLSNQFPLLKQIGISGFGIAAPFVALVFYAIFPIVHNTQAAFKMIRSEYIEIGRSLGMNSRQIFLQVKMPIALPVIMSGIRIAVVYSVSGVTLAAFIGGGGLGTFILQNDSMDFVLLGALPVIGITFIADSILQFIINRLNLKRGIVQ